MSNPANQAAELERAHSEQAHPAARLYVVIGVILAVLTAAEVAAFYIDALRPVLGYILVVLSLAKFFLVIGYYMHLKFDHRVFALVFFAPMILSLGMVIGFILLFKVLVYV